MANNIVHGGGPGSVINWTNSGAAISAGTPVVVGNVLGIALTDIAAGAVGSVQIAGVVRGVNKKTGVAFAQGQNLVWLKGTTKMGGAADAATGDMLNCATAFVAAASGDTACVVRLNGWSTPSA